MSDLSPPSAPKRTLTSRERSIAKTRAPAQERMFANLANPRFLTDKRPLLPVPQSDLWTDSTKAAFRKVFTQITDLIPVDPWLRLAEMNERFGLDTKAN